MWFPTKHVFYVGVVDAIGGTLNPSARRSVISHNMDINAQNHFIQACSN
jgi:hypothetical protein